MKKIIPITILILIATAILIWVKPKNISNSSAEIPVNPISGITPGSLDVSLPFSNDPKDVAWAVFQQYLSYNKDKNLEGVKQTVYKISPVCTDPKTLIDCEARMGAAYKYGSALKKSDFTNVWSDSKQTILATDFKINEDDRVIGKNRSIIFFVKGTDGKLKMLSFSPFQGSTITKGNASKEELLDRIVTYTEDEDNDGISSYVEECVSASTKATCIPTNPHNRDTNNDGYWDGVEALMEN